jgi:5-deoxy-glucuronate isomerase
MPIHPAAVPNHLSPDELRLRTDPAGRVGVTAERAGWRYLSFETLCLTDERSFDLGANEEAVLVTIAGGGIDAEIGGRSWRLEGRASAFDGLPWALYVPSAGHIRLSPRCLEGHPTVTVVIARAPRSGRPDVADTPILIGPGDVEIEVRGAGNATRQITHIIKPDFPADRLLVVEVHTPSGNWSSWPPHKHDVDAMPDEAVLEETYFYQFRRPEAWAIQRLYRRGEPGDGLRDAMWTVRHGDLVLVTDGYHPFVTSHGNDAYYLNVLAGDRRTMAFSFDPDLAWVAPTWADMARDPRVPLVPRRSPSRHA